MCISNHEIHHPTFYFIFYIMCKIIYIRFPIQESTEYYKLMLEVELLGNEIRLQPNKLIDYCFDQRAPLIKSLAIFITDFPSCLHYRTFILREVEIQGKNDG